MIYSFEKKADAWGFSDGQLREAACAVRESMLESLDAETEEHSFSEDFLSRMRGLLRRDERRNKLRRMLQRAAVFIIGVFLLGSLLAVSNPQARAMFSRLVKNEYEDRTEYSFSPATQQGGSPASYKKTIPDIEFGWLPGDYDLYVVSKDSIGMVVIAENKGEIAFVFSCVLTNLNGGTAISSDGVPIRCETVNISGREADFFEGVDNNDTNKLVWVNKEENVLFILDSSLPKETLIKIAEAIIEIQ